MEYELEPILKITTTTGRRSLKFEIRGIDPTNPDMDMGASFIITESMLKMYLGEDIKKINIRDLFKNDMVKRGFIAYNVKKFMEVWMDKLESVTINE